MKNSRLVLLTMVGIFVLSVVVYLPMVKNEFVYDDFWLIVENEFIKDFSNVKRLFSIEYLKRPFPVRGGARPVTLVSLILDYKLWGLNPVGFRFTNIFLHSINSVLVFLFMIQVLNRGKEVKWYSGIVCGKLFQSSKLKVQVEDKKLVESVRTKEFRVKSLEFRDKSSQISFECGVFASFVGSLIFMLHPLQVESMGVVSFRNGILGVMFVMVGLLLVTNYKLQIADYRLGVFIIIASIMMFVLAVLSKELYVVFGIVIWYMISLGKGRYFKLISGVGIFLLSLGLLSFWYQRVKYKFFNMIFVNILDGINPLESWNSYFNTIFASVRHYVEKIFFPIGLSIDYQVKVYDSLWNINFFVFIVVVVMLVVLFIKVKDLLVRLGIIFLVVNYLPVSNIVPLANTVTDRYMYGVMIGVGMMVAGVLCQSLK